MKRGRSPHRKHRGWFARALRWAIGAGLIFVLGSLAWVGIYFLIPPPITFTQVGDLLGGRSISRDWMSLDEIDRDMVRAVIAAEDSKFCAHHGFDQDAIAQAMRRNARGGKVIRGGSTISQQTAKNAFLWQGGGYFRKAIEAWFTLLIETVWGKKRIIEVYLNIAETGIGTYGVNAGAQRYFKHDASNMSRNEAARIAAVLPLPKKRGAVTPRGFTRRYGNSIAVRIGVVARDGLDACVYEGAVARNPSEAVPVERKSRPKKSQRQVPAAEPEVAVTPAPETPGDEYELPEQPIETPIDPVASEPVEEPTNL